MSDQYPSETIHSLLDKVKANDAAETAFVAGLKYPVDSSSNPPSIQAVIGPKAADGWQLRENQSSYCVAIRAKQKAQGLATSSTPAIVVAARSGNYSHIPGA